MERNTDASPAQASLAMSDKLRRRSAITALLTAAIAFLLALPAFASADLLTGSATMYKENLRPTAWAFNNVAGPEGNVWFTDGKTIAGTSAIGKITPSGTITEYVSGEGLSGLNAEANLAGITIGPEKKLWLTDWGPNPGIVVIDPASPGTATEYSLEAGSMPQGIVTGPDGNLWFADRGATPAIGMIDPSEPSEIKECSILANGGNEGSAPTGIVAGADGNLWFTDPSPAGVKAIGRVNPSTCEIKEFETGATSTPGGSPAEFGPWGIAAGVDGNIWFTGAGGEGAAAIGMIDPSKPSEINKYGTGFLASSGTFGLTAAADGKLWFTDNSGLTEQQKIKFEGTWATGNEFELCNESKSSCSKKAYSTTLTTLRNNVKNALLAIYGAETVNTPSCSGTPFTCTFSFNEEGPLVDTNVGQTSCATTKGEGTCKGETSKQGVDNAVGSITTSGTITRYPIDGLYQPAGIAYSGGNVWFNDGIAGLSKIGKFGIEPTSLTLKVTKTGSGSGTVTSEPAGINCGSECSASFSSGTEVTLKGAPDPGSEPVEWSGCSEEKEGNCIVKVGGFNTIEVTAKFNEEESTNLRPLSLSQSGNGTVSSKPKGVKCAAACSSANASFYKNTVVTLTAKPGTGATFAGWTSGAGTCTGTTTPCTVTMSEAQSLTAAFSAGKAIVNPQALTFVKEGTGKGTVKATGLTCEAECTSTVVSYYGPVVVPKAKAGATVTLKQAPAFGSTFSGWTGCGEEKEGNCIVSMSSAKEVKASYTLLPTKVLTIEQSGNGTVSSKPKALKCAAACSSTSGVFPEGAVVTLTAKPGTGATFTGWTTGAGTCTGTTSPCQVTMSAAKSLTAAFSAGKAIVNPQTLTLTKAGKGQGTVKATGLTCEALCTSTVVSYYGPVVVPKAKAGATVTLTAVSAPGSKPVEWSGCGEEKEGACIVSMSAAKAVTATFQPLK